MKLAHAVDMFNDSLPAHIGVVVGIVESGDSDGVPDLDTRSSEIVDILFGNHHFSDVILRSF